MNELINDLYNKIDNQDKIINEQVLEIARLNKRIDKAIEYIKNNFCIENCLDLKELLEILGDKE